jgi:solute carrier family 25 S-adenosylmethionine transporter 26
MHSVTAAAAAAAALYPIDTIKTRLQAMIGGGGIKALLSSGGGKGLYAGVWGNLAGATSTLPQSLSVLSFAEGAAVCNRLAIVYDGVRAFCHVSLLSGGGKGLYAGVWGNLAGAARTLPQSLSVQSFAKESAV